MNLSWGKPRIFTMEEGSETFKEQNTPVENTTHLVPEKGETKDATVEGGDIEDSKTKPTKYSVEYDIRKKKGRKDPFPSLNGVVNKKYAFILMPEDSTNEGFYIESTSVSIDSDWTAEEGGIWKINHKALRAASGNTIKWGTVSIADSGGKKITFTETSPAEGSQAVTVSKTVTELADGAAA